jgi:hypothetical protein
MSGYAAGVLADLASNETYETTVLEKPFSLNALLASLRHVLPDAGAAGI